MHSDQSPDSNHSAPVPREALPNSPSSSPLAPALEEVWAQVRNSPQSEQAGPPPKEHRNEPSCNADLAGVFSLPARAQSIRGMGSRLTPQVHTSSTLGSQRRLTRSSVKFATCPPILECWSFFLDLQVLHLVEFLETGFPVPLCCQMPWCCSVTGFPELLSVSCCCCCCCFRLDVMTSLRILFGAGRGVESL